MTIILYNTGGAADYSNDTLPGMNFELAGIFDINFVVAKFGSQAALDFMQKQHPRVAPLDLIGCGPRWMVSVNQSSKNAGEKGLPFGIFLATKDVNPQYKGALRSRSELQQYVDSVKVLMNNTNWKTWDDAISHFCKK